MAEQSKPASELRRLVANKQVPAARHSLALKQLLLARDKGGFATE